LSISNRFRIYIRATFIYVLTLLASILLIHLTNTYGNRLMTLISGGLLIVVMIKFPIDIGIRTINPQSFSQYLKIGAVIVIWSALLILKVEVNESANFHSFNRISESRRHLHYFLFSIWSLILIWETTIQVGNFISKKVSNKR
jgi:hypothetical protein